MFLPFRTLVILKLFLVLLLLPQVALAGYDQERIKKEIEQDTKHFHVKKWKKTDADNSWISTDETNHFFVGVTPTTASVMNAVIDQLAALDAMTRCNTLGVIVMQPNSKQQRDQIFDSITIWKNGNINSVTFNGMVFEAKMLEFGDSVILNCTAKAV